MGREPKVSGERRSTTKSEGGGKVIDTAAPRCTGGDQYDLDSNHFSATEENAGGRLTSTFDSATGITTAYTYKPNTNYIQTETSVTSASSVVHSVLSACLLMRPS